MDPVALIMTALAARAGPLVQDEASDAVRFAYVRLREAVRQRLAGRPGGDLALAKYEFDSRAGKEPLAAELAWAGAGDDAGLVGAALAVLELADETEARVGKHMVLGSGAQGVQTGDHNGQVNYFIGDYIDLRPAAEPAGDVQAGWPLTEVTDPFALEVHRSVQPDNPLLGQPVLPTYVSREHDLRLAEVVRAAAEGASGIAVLVGGSSTGKTRACWEALGLLRGRSEPWRLWHPIDPSRPEAALRDLPFIGPRTVIWLNEAQFYLDATSGLGERVAAGLRELLRDAARAPVLVLATLWPQFWDRLTARPLANARDQYPQHWEQVAGRDITVPTVFTTPRLPSLATATPRPQFWDRAPENADDPHAQARELLANGVITVPAGFTPAQLPLLSAAGDPRLALAAKAEDGRVIQFLAGAPELTARYHNAPPPAAALINAAMDARRLGMGMALPLDFLEAATPGYLDDSDWDVLPEDWLEQALSYTATPCKGTRGPLARIRPRPPVPDQRPYYRLADYLDQHGRQARRSHIPPASFWNAATRFASPGDLPALVGAAEGRGLLLDAARLRKRAVGLGDSDQGTALICSVISESPDLSPAQWVIDHVFLDNPNGVAVLLDTLRRKGKDEQATEFARRIAAHASLDNPDSVTLLWDILRWTGADEQATEFARRAAAQAPLDNPDSVAELLVHLRSLGASEQADALLARNPAAYVSLDNPDDLARLLGTLQRTGASEQADVLLARNPAAYVSLDNPDGVARLLDTLRSADAGEQAHVLLARNPAAHVSLDNPDHLARLLDTLQGAGAGEQATVLARRAAAHACLNDPNSIARLLVILRNMGACEEADTLLARNLATHVSLDDPTRLAGLVENLRWAGAHDEAATLARRAAAHVSLDKPDRLAILLDTLRRAGAGAEAVALARRAAAHAPLDNPVCVALLITHLKSTGADEEAATLARRAGAHALSDNANDVFLLMGFLRSAGADEEADALLAGGSLGNPGSVARLLDTLRRTGKAEQVSALLARNPAAYVSLDNPDGVAQLLDTLRGARAAEQVSALLARNPAAYVSLDNRNNVAKLLDVLRKADAHAQATTLVNRLPAEGHFALFRSQAGHQMQYRFGREPDGGPTPPWGWAELD